MAAGERSGRLEDIGFKSHPGEVPSLDAFLKAFSLEDEAEVGGPKIPDGVRLEATSAALGAPMSAFAKPSPPWEVAAVVVLQRNLRRVLGCKGKAHR